MSLIADAVTAGAIKDFVVAEIGKPVFDQFGRLAVDTAGKLEAFFRTKLDNHHHLHIRKFFGREFAIDEFAPDVGGRRVRLTVAVSPEGRMNGQSFENSGKTAKKAREGALKCLELLAKYTYNY